MAMGEWADPKGRIVPDTDASLEKEVEKTKSGIRKFGEGLGILVDDFSGVREKLKELNEYLGDLEKHINDQQKALIELKKKKAEAEARGDDAAATSIQTSINAIKADLSENERKRQLYIDEKTKEREKLKRDNTTKLISNITKAIVSLIDDFKKAVDGVIDRFMSTQQSMAYNLIGTGKKLQDVKDDLSEALNGRGIVEIEKVYNKIGEYVKDGIVYNAEQRAYLATLVDEVGLHFNVTSSSLLRLINLQRTDLTSSRLAVADSLKEYLNQNYETSQYIKDGFEKISDSLLEAQSLMSAREGMALEATLQKWMGVLYSLGLSEGTMSGISQALGQLGSGNLSALSGSKYQNLLIMGASRSGQDYAEMLTSGINSENINSIMRGIVSYMSEIGARDSNVVKSAFGDLFGFSISDLKAVANLGNNPLNGELGTNINKFLLKADQSIWEVTEIANILKNIEWSIGSSIASSDTKYLLYKTIDIVSNFAGNLLQGTSLNLGLFTTLGFDLGTIAKMVPIITLGIMGFPAIKQGLSNMGSGGLFSDDTASIVYNALGSTAPMRSGSMTGDITGLSTTKGKQKSGSVIMTEAGQGEVVDTAKTSSNTIEETALSEDEDKDVSHKIYDLIGGDDSTTTVIELLSLLNTTVEKLPNQLWNTTTTASQSTVNIGGNGTNPSNYMSELLSYTAISAVHLANIQAILLAIQSGGLIEFDINSYEDIGLGGNTVGDISSKYQSLKVG